MTDRKAIKKDINKIQWFHSIDLGNGNITPGQDNSKEKLSTLHLPNLSGKTVIDVGSWDGFFAFEAEKLGAARVLATDHFCWGGEGWGTKAGFDFARSVLKSKVEDMEIDVTDISKDTVGTFDVTLFLGVLYHMKHPLLILEKMSEITTELMVLETQVDLMSCPFPAMRFYPGKELGEDATNWWGPNALAVETMLLTVGFQKVDIVHTKVDGDMGRLVAHAWK